MCFLKCSLEINFETTSSFSFGIVPFFRGCHNKTTKGQNSVKFMPASCDAFSPFWPLDVPSDQCKISTRRDL